MTSVFSRFSAALCVLFLLPAPASAKKAAKLPTLAISYFDNNSNDRGLDALKKGLADMLITDLSNVPGVSLVERSRLEAIIKELKLSKSKLIDRKTALKMGKVLSARFLMAGSYAVMGQKMRIDARLLEVQTGKILASHKVNGTKEDFFAMEKELAELIIDTLQLKLTFKAKAKLRRNATQSFDAFQHYSSGLNAQDLGDTETAKKLFAKAVAADPNYKAAKSALGRLNVVIDKAEDAQRADATKAAGALDPTSKNFAADFSMLMLKLDNSDAPQYKRKLELLIRLIKNDTIPIIKSQYMTSSPLVDEVLRLMGFYISDPRSWDALFGTCEWALKTIPGYQLSLSLCRSFRMQIEMKKKHSKRDKLMQDWKNTEKNAISAMRAKYTYYRLGRSLFELCAKKAGKM